MSWARHACEVGVLEIGGVWLWSECAKSIVDITEHRKVPFLCQLPALTESWNRYVRDDNTSDILVAVRMLRLTSRIIHPREESGVETTASAPALGQSHYYTYRG
jgi:hypothetical protein